MYRLLTQENISISVNSLHLATVACDTTEGQRAAYALRIIRAAIPAAIAIRQAQTVQLDGSATVLWKNTAVN